MWGNPVPAIRLALNWPCYDWLPVDFQSYVRAGFGAERAAVTVLIRVKGCHVIAAAVLPTLIDIEVFFCANLNAVTASFAAFFIYCYSGHFCSPKNVIEKPFRLRLRDERVCFRGTTLFGCRKGRRPTLQAITAPGRFSLIACLTSFQRTACG